MVAHMIANAIRNTPTSTMTEADMAIVRSLLAEQMIAIEGAATTLSQAPAVLPPPKEERPPPKNPSYIG